MSTLNPCFFITIMVLTALRLAAAPPPPQRPIKNTVEQAEAEPYPDSDDFDLGTRHYNKYLMDVVSVLDGDEHGKKLLQEMSQIDIALGNFTKDFKLKSKEAYEQLNQLKSDELERLRHLMKTQQGIPNDLTDHIDTNKRHFDNADLILLLQKTIKDIDEKRKEAFKNYEMEKAYNKTKMLEKMSPEQKIEFQKAEKDHENKRQLDEKKNPTHEPGSKEQLVEVAEEKDHLENFDPKTFFHLHDLDGNGLWDEDEIGVVIQNEVDKRFPPNDPTVDPVEKEEFRENVKDDILNEVDTNKDLFISLNEFLKDYNEPETHDANKPEEHTTLYSPEEYQDMVEERERLFDRHLTTMNINQLRQNDNSTINHHEQQQLENNRV
ncbi:nucleobindin-2-like [Gordionus sp. m RMFG-2023]|uniref:nucleobindin-2-like n=1 Tax=Gordionus sp. m RMFG-2023 TaxID=3053472 RepID=UPI0031FC3482